MVSPAQAEDVSDNPYDAGDRKVRPEALIDVPIGMILMPKDENGRQINYRPEEEFKCFAVSEWNQMAHLITDYRWLWLYAIQMETKAALLDKEIGNLQLQLGLVRDELDTTRSGLKSMTGLLKTEQSFRLSEETRQRVEIWLWRVGTVVGLVAAGAFAAAWGVERSQ